MAFSFSFRSNPRQDKPAAEPSSQSFLVDEKAPSPLAIIYRSELDYLSRCILDYPNIETGGQLFGFWTNQGVPVVLYVIGPGEGANHQRTFFNQDVSYLETIGNELLSRYALQHIGEWHSHHQLDLARPSGHDAQTMFHGLQRIPTRRLLLCIGNYEGGRSAINPYCFHENDLRHYADAAWRVKEVESPYRPLIDRELEHLLIHPYTAEPRHGQMRFTPDAAQPQKKEPGTVQFDQGYWFVRTGNIEQMKQMVATTKSVLHREEVGVQASEDGIVQMVVNEGQLIIRFPKDFPAVAPQLFIEGEEEQGPEWIAPWADRYIADAFTDWIERFAGSDIPADNNETPAENLFIEDSFDQ